MPGAVKTSSRNEMNTHYREMVNAVLDAAMRHGRINRKMFSWDQQRTTALLRWMVRVGHLRTTVKGTVGRYGNPTQYALIDE